MGTLAAYFLVVRLPEVYQLRDVVGVDQHIARAQVHVHHIVVLDQSQSLQDIDQHVQLRGEGQDLLFLGHES